MVRNTKPVMGMTLVACAWLALPIQAQIPGVVIFQDPAGATACSTVIAENAELAVLAATDQDPQQLVLISGGDVVLASSRVDANGSVFFENLAFGSLDFHTDGDGRRRLFWVDAVGNVLAIDPITLAPETTDRAPEDLEDNSCDACDFWDNAADCPGGEPEETVIVTQPGSGTACAGERISIFVEAAGKHIESYQWFKNGAAIPGETGPILTFDKIVVFDTAAYTVDVIDEDGSRLTSEPAIVAVEPECESPRPPGLGLCGPGTAMIGGVLLLMLVGWRTRRTVKSEE